MSDGRPGDADDRAAKSVFRSGLREIGSTAGRELAYYRAVAEHAATPRLAKLLLGAAIAYLLSPIDVIPDFIPIIGHVDDAVVVPLLILVAIRRIPQRVLQECREATSEVR